MKKAYLTSNEKVIYELILTEERYIEFSSCEIVSWDGKDYVFDINAYDDNVFYEADKFMVLKSEVFSRKAVT